MRPPPQLVLVHGGKLPAPAATGLDLVQLLLQIWNPWDFQSHQQSRRDEIVPDTGVYPVVDDAWFDQLLKEYPPAPSKDRSYLELTRQALGGAKPAKVKSKPRTKTAEEWPYKVHPKALGDFVRFFFDTIESVRGFIQRRLTKRHGKHVVQAMDYAQLAHLRELERKSLIKHLNTLIEKYGKRQRGSDEWRVRHERKGHPPKIFFVEIDVHAGKIIKVLLEKDRNRRKSYKTARQRCYQHSRR